jgi:hypothetical protein
MSPPAIRAATGLLPVSDSHKSGTGRRRRKSMQRTRKIQTDFGFPFAPFA